jgi:hypothetical protein
MPDSSFSTTVPNLTRYLNNPNLLVFCRSRFSMITMLTLSSSVTRITHGWTRAGKDVWDVNFVPRNRLDFGIGGNQTQHVL